MFSDDVKSIEWYFGNRLKSKGLSETWNRIKTAQEEAQKQSAQIAFEIESGIDKSIGKSLIDNNVLRGWVRQLRTFQNVERKEDK